MGEFPLFSSIMEFSLHMHELWMRIELHNCSWLCMHTVYRNNLEIMHTFAVVATVPLNLQQYLSALLHIIADIYFLNVGPNQSIVKDFAWGGSMQQGFQFFRCLHVRHRLTLISLGAERFLPQWVVWKFHNFHWDWVEAILQFHFFFLKCLCPPIDISVNMPMWVQLSAGILTRCSKWLSAHSCQTQDMCRLTILLGRLLDNCRKKGWKITHDPEYLLENKRQHSL